MKSNNDPVVGIYRYCGGYENNAREMFDRIKAAGFDPQWKEPLFVGVKRTELDAFKKHAKTQEDIFGDLC